MSRNVRISLSENDTVIVGIGRKVLELQYSSRNSRSSARPSPPPPAARRAASGLQGPSWEASPSMPADTQTRSHRARADNLNVEQRTVDVVLVDRRGGKRRAYRRTVHRRTFDGPEVPSGSTG